MGKTERDWDKTQQGKTNRKKLEKDFKRDRAKKKKKKQTGECLDSK